MYKFILILGLLFTSVIVFGQNLGVRIIQEGKAIVPQGDKFILKNSSFTFQIKSKGIEGFLVGATRDKDVYESALGKADLEVAWFDNTGMADERFNENKILTISNDTPGYWYFTSIEDHRFDKNAEGNVKSWTANRTVEKLEFIEADQVISLANATEPFYVIFYLAEYDDHYMLINKKIVFSGEFIFL